MKFPQDSLERLTQLKVAQFALACAKKHPEGSPRRKQLLQAVQTLLDPPSSAPSTGAKPLQGSQS